MKWMLTLFGSLSLLLGIIGIGVPGLPTTPFLLLSAACFARSSPRFHNWLIRHRTYGPIIADYVQKQGIKKRTKITAMILMWSMALLSVLLFLDNHWLKGIVLISALIGTFVVLRLKTL